MATTLDYTKYDGQQIHYHWGIEFFVGDDAGKIIKAHTLKSVRKINDYQKNFFPIFQLEIGIRDIYFDLIFKKQSNLTCRLTLTRLKYNAKGETDTDSDTDDSVEKEIVLQDMFIPFFDEIPGDVLPSANLATEEDIGKEDQMNQTEDSIGSASSTIVTVTLWHINSLISHKSIFNQIFEDCSVGSAIGYIINNTEFIKEAIVDIPQRTEEFGELVLLPYGLRDSFYSLQYRYGIYINGLWLFLDNGTLYCLKAYSTKHQHKKDSAAYTSLFLHQTPNSKSFPFVMGINKSDKSHYYDVSGKLSKINKDVVFGELYGDKMLFSNLNTIFSSVEGNGDNIKFKSAIDQVLRDAKSHSKTSMKIELDYDELNNPYNLYAENRKLMLDSGLSLTVYGADIDSFTPEKVIELQIDDKEKSLELGGKYCIVNVIYVFTPEKSFKDKFETTAAAQITIMKVPEELE